MTSVDFQAFAVFAMVGFAVGVVASLVFSRSRHPYLWTALGSAFGATLLALLGILVLQTISAATKDGYPLGRALQAGVAASFILAFAVPVVCGGPAAVMGCFCQLCLQRLRHRNSRPPPLPK